MFVLKNVLELWDWNVNLTLAKRDRNQKLCLLINPLQNITLLKHYWNILRIGPHNRGLLLILQHFSDRKICSTPVHACFSNSNFVRVIDMAIVRSSNSQIFFKNTYVETAGLKFLRMPFFYRASPVAASVLLPICELRTFFKWLYC